MTKRAIYAGSFDPITKGHVDLISRTVGFVDHLIVAVAINSAKQPMFTVEERTQMIAETFKGDSRVEVQSFTGLLVEFAKRVNSRLLIRGLRAVSDFEYEYQMALMNRHLSQELETVFMLPSLDTTYISATLVREVARYGGDLTSLVPPVVADALRRKMKSA
jgi:pantetheine-phosphate adenylyltransferase